MNRNGIVLTLSAVFTIVAEVAVAQERRDPEWLKEMAPKRIVYAVPGMDRVVVRKNLTYKTAEKTELKMDVYTPAGLAKGEKRPAVVFVHGGFLPPDLLTEPKDWGTYISYGELAAASGFVGITFNHRFYGPEFLDTASGDILDAIRFVRENAESLGVDRDRLAVWAFSGGGPFLSPLLRESPSYLRGIVSYYAFLALERRPEIPASITDETLKAFSAVDQLRARTGAVPPVLIARAGQDNPAINRSVEAFVAEAFAKNVMIEVLVHPQGRHGFDVLDDDARSREIIARTIEFLRARLGG